MGLPRQNAPAPLWTTGFTLNQQPASREVAHQRARAELMDIWYGSYGIICWHSADASTNRMFRQRSNS